MQVTLQQFVLKNSEKTVQYSQEDLEFNTFLQNIIVKIHKEFNKQIKNQNFLITSGLMEIDNGQLKLKPDIFNNQENKLKLIQTLRHNKYIRFNFIKIIQILMVNFQELSEKRRIKTKIYNMSPRSFENMNSKIIRIRDLCKDILVIVQQMNDRRMTIIDDIVQLEQIDINSLNALEDVHFLDDYLEGIDMKKGQKFVGTDVENKSDMIIIHKHNQAVKYLDDIVNR